MQYLSSSFVIFFSLTLFPFLAIAQGPFPQWEVAGALPGSKSTTSATTTTASTTTTTASTTTTTASTTTTLTSSLTAISSQIPEPSTTSLPVTSSSIHSVNYSALMLPKISATGYDYYAERAYLVNKVFKRCSINITLDKGTREDQYFGTIEEVRHDNKEENLVEGPPKTVPLAASGGLWILVSKLRWNLTVQALKRSDHPNSFHGTVNISATLNTSSMFDPPHHRIITHPEAACFPHRISGFCQDSGWENMTGTVRDGMEISATRKLEVILPCI